MSSVDLVYSAELVSSINLVSSVDLVYGGLNSVCYNTPVLSMFHIHNQNVI